MTPRSIQALALMPLVFSTGCAASGGTTTTGEGGDGVPASNAPHDTFHVLAPGGAEYQYDCTAQPAELSVGFGGDGRGYAVMKTLGCAWPTSSPIVEIDVQIQSVTPIQDQTFDLAATPAATIEITSGLIGSSSGNSLFASWENNPTPGSGSPIEITTAGTSGTVVVHSFDPTTGSLDVSLQDVVLPGSALSSSAVSGAMTIVTGEVVR
jgi:hypothetical protein